MTPDSCPAVLGMILKGYPRISETFISNEILLLERSGFSLVVYSMRQPREVFHHDSVGEIRAQAFYLPETLLEHLVELLWHNICLALSTPRTYGTALTMTARRFLRTRKSASIKHLLQAGYLIHRFVPKNLAVSRFHAHFAHSPASVAMYVSRITGIPFRITAHAKDIYTSDPVQLAEKMDQAEFVVTCTESNRRYLLNLPTKKNTPVYRVYHGIDIRLFTPEAVLRTPEPPFRLLTVARITPKKGLPTVYRALRRLADAGLDFHHTLIGDGEDQGRIADLIRKLGLESRTRLLGVQPHHVVLDHYRNADLFVIGCEIAPSGDRDGIPNVLAESMAMNVPVVATTISGIPELITSEDTGLLVEPGDSHAMALAMIRMLLDRCLREKVIRAARSRVLQDFDNRRLIRELVEIYRCSFPGPV